MIKPTTFVLFVIIPLLISFSEMQFDFGQIILNSTPESVEVTSFNYWIEPIPSMLVMLDEIGWAS
jgi:hypothetical protein